MLVNYNSNNSGGVWWLSDKNWHDLEKAGWNVEWRKDNWLNCLASKASKEFDTFEEAVAEWEKITGQNSEDEGCECCGRPHYFW